MRYVNCEFFSIQRHVDLFTVHISHYSAHDMFNLKLWFENNLHGLRMDFLSIGFCKQTNKQRMTTKQHATKERIGKD